MLTKDKRTQPRMTDLLRRQVETKEEEENQENDEEEVKKVEEEEEKEEVKASQEGGPMAQTEISDTKEEPMKRR